MMETTGTHHHHPVPFRLVLIAAFGVLTFFLILFLALREDYTSTLRRQGDINAAITQGRAKIEDNQRTILDAIERLDRRIVTLQRKVGIEPE